MTDRTVPNSTYRLQLRSEFGFDAAAAQADYLAALGVSHVYSSPYLQAAAGSTHGYDGVDPTRVSDDLGGTAAHRRFVAAVQRAGLGQVLDIVPNHLSTTDPRNRWWWDVLRAGEASEYARHFDIEWRSDDPQLDGKVVLPILGRTLDEELADGAIRVEGRDGAAEIVYYDTRLPAAEGSVADGRTVADVLAAQHYVLMFWRDGLAQVKHRRFFDVTTLVGVRVEDERVFADVHRAVLGWVAAGEISGLRVDHPDGLADPTQYVQRLAAAAPSAWIVVEKILEPGEELRDDWPVDGTTGYDALNTFTGVLVDPAGEAALTKVHAEITGSSEDFEEVARGSRVEVVHTLLAPELDRTATAFAAVTGRTATEVREVVAAFVAELPVYRTYVQPGTQPSDADRQAVDVALERLRTHHAQLDQGIAVELAEVLLERGCDPSAGDDVRSFVRLLQQLSGPAMAKGVEDTAFYRYTRFVAANEVGGDPQRIGIPLAELHAANRRRAQRWPSAMVSTSTHDTKRSEDVRARLAVLAEMADEWADTLRRWCARSGDWWAAHAAGARRDPALESLVHQTLVGAHPLSAERAHAYLEKAMREAKTATSWLDPDERFEAAAHGLVDHLLVDAEHQRELDALVQAILVPGRINALAQKLLALTVPGVPDIYQGTELWSLDLVDPDNRRPVDYELRRELLAGLCERTNDGSICALTQTLEDADDPGVAKLLVVQRALDLRRRRRTAFLGEGAAYTPVAATGVASEHAIAFQRGSGEDAVVAVAPRLPLRLARDGGWRDTVIEIAAGGWRDVLSGATVDGGAVSLRELLSSFPVALLERT